MAKKTVNPVSKPPAVAPAQGIRLLQQQIEKAKALRQTNVSSSEYEAWRTTLHEVTRIALGTPHETGEAIVSAGSCYSGIFGGSSESEKMDERKKNLEAIVLYLESAIEQLNLKITDHSPEKPEVIEQFNLSSAFIVHGHADAIREKVARFLKDVEVKPVILSEADSAGLTVIEKLEREASQVGYAIVLLTGDDVGCTKDSAPVGLHPRARQNVILELGYFIAKLGRSRVCLLFEKGIELPSDVAGVVYIEIDPADAWKLRVGKEMRAVGFSIDMNKI
ncbi:TIR domain-containing protein [Bdellovibrio bacteriovorus]|uniref:TIR domain-containing protein n=1 Tax=Bdellovibrio bacteriovorus TaxID=959 RepID=UPI003AA85C68